MTKLRIVKYLAIVLPLLILTGLIYAQTNGNENMVLVPGGEFTKKVEYRWREGLTLDSLITDDAGVRYRSTTIESVSAFYIDKTEVTNKQYKQFIEGSGYKPKFLENYLKHWNNDTYPKKKANHPVVWISLEDAQAYAKWAGKRLPTDTEWQRAAQGDDGRTWPWGNLFDAKKANIDSKDTRPVASYKTGVSPYGLFDMTGNVWEWTDSFASDGYHSFSWLRGGSYFFAKGSTWYMQGGPITNHQRTKFWHMTPALNRNATLGFRCAKDAG